MSIGYNHFHLQPQLLRSWPDGHGTSGDVQVDNSADLLWRTPSTPDAHG